MSKQSVDSPQADALSEVTIFTDRQQQLYNLLLEQTNEKCFHDNEWRGEDKYFVVPYGDELVFKSFQKFCQSKGANLYWGLVDDGKWMVGVVSPMMR